MGVLRRLVVFAALLAIGWAAFVLMAPVRAQPSRLLPGGGVLPPALEETKVSCGSVIDPKPLDGIAQALQLECPRLLRTQQRKALTIGGAAAAAGVLALIVLRAPRSKRHPGGSAGSSPDGGATRPPKVRPPQQSPAPLGPPAALDAPTSGHYEPATSIPVSHILDAPAAGSGRRSALLAGAAAAVVALAVIVIVATAGSDREGSTSGDAEPGGPFRTAAATTEPLTTLEERECMLASLGGASSGFSSAIDQSRYDLEKGRLNMDGDGSFESYAASLAATDITRCPLDFRDQFVGMTALWREFGNAWRESTKPLGDDLSDDDTRYYQARLNESIDRLVSSAEELSVEFQTWGISVTSG